MLSVLTVDQIQGLFIFSRVTYNELLLIKELFETFKTTIVCANNDIYTMLRENKPGYPYQQWGQHPCMNQAGCLHKLVRAKADDGKPYLTHNQFYDLQNFVQAVGLTAYGTTPPVTRPRNPVVVRS